MQDTIPYIWKNDTHTPNLNRKRARMASEAMWKAGSSVDWWRLTQEDINDILGFYTQSETEKDLSNNLDTRYAVLQRVNNGDIVYAEYPLAPYSKKEIRPIQS